MIKERQSRTKKLGLFIHPTGEINKPHQTFKNVLERLKGQPKGRICDFSKHYQTKSLTFTYNKNWAYVIISDLNWACAKSTLTKNVSFKVHTIFINQSPTNSIPLQTFYAIGIIFAHV